MQINNYNGGELGSWSLPSTPNHNTLERDMTDSFILPPNSKAIPLTCGYQSIVDEDWFDILNSINCSVLYSGKYRTLRYAVCNISINGKSYSEMLHRVIMDAPRNLQVDHINHNTLDNRKENLRLCTPQENNRNLRPIKKTSAYKGVFFCKQTNKWSSAIQINGKTIRIGRFDSEEFAAQKYDSVARILHGEFSYLNFPNIDIGLSFSEKKYDALFGSKALSALDKYKGGV